MKVIGEKFELINVTLKDVFAAVRDYKKNNPGYEPKEILMTKAEIRGLKLNIKQMDPDDNLKIYPEIKPGAMIAGVVIVEVDEEE